MFNFKFHPRTENFYANSVEVVYDILQLCLTCSEQFAIKQKKFTNKNMYLNLIYHMSLGTFKTNVIDQHRSPDQLVK